MLIIFPRYIPGNDQQGRRPPPKWIQRKMGREKIIEEAEKQAEIEQYIIDLEVARKYPLSVIESLRRMDLEDFDLVLMVQLLKHICTRMEEGAVLIFLPGWDTISKLHDMLQSDVMFRNSSRHLIIPLHSMMPTTYQKQVGVV